MIAPPASHRSFFKSVEDRRAMIVRAAIPLTVELGPAVTTFADRPRHGHQRAGGPGEPRARWEAAAIGCPHTSTDGRGGRHDSTQAPPGPDRRDRDRVRVRLGPAGVLRRVCSGASAVRETTLPGSRPGETFLVGLIPDGGDPEDAPSTRVTGGITVKSAMGMDGYHAVCVFAPVG
jgi:hypothetical protein